jgi:hypothetical protein
VHCPDGQHCRGGACVDDCDGVACPTNRVCRRVSVNGGVSHAACVDLCNPTPCKPGFDCQWRTGACTPHPFREAGLDAPPDLIDPLVLGGAGWLCTGAGAARASAAFAIGGAGIVAIALGARRLRRRR